MVYILFDAQEGANYNSGWEVWGYDLKIVSLCCDLEIFQFSPVVEDQWLLYNWEFMGTFLINELPWLLVDLLKLAFPGQV